MLRYSTKLLVAFLIVTPAFAVEPFPSGFHTQEINTNGTTLHVRIGGQGAAVVMLHGFGDTGDMWAPAAAALVKTHTVVVPDLRGMGLSTHPEQGYTKKNQAADSAGVMDARKISSADLVTHEIGNMVGYALAAQYPTRITKWVVIDAPLPGIGNWEEIKQSPLLWHFNFRGPDEERLVAGRERIYLDRFYNELSADPKKIDGATRQHYAALYARPHALHDPVAQFGALHQHALDNKEMLTKGSKLAMPVLAAGGEKSFGTAQADTLRFVATNVTVGIVPGSGHSTMHETPKPTTPFILYFLSN